MTAELCVFCQRADRPMTREHVFAQWLVRQVRGARLVPSNTPPTDEPSSSTPTRISRVFADVCAVCNAGWMSSLEVSFRRALFKGPRSGPLQAPDRVTLSRWFTKTAVLLAEAHGGALVGATDRARLITGMPEDVEVYIARRRRPRQKLDFTLEVLVVRGPRQLRSVAMQVDDLAAHVAPRGALTSRHGTRLWPLRTHALRWDTLPVI